MESSRKNELGQKSSKLKKKEILQFYSIIKAAALRGESGPCKMISDRYYHFLHHVLNSQHTQPLKTANLVGQLKLLKESGFFEVPPNKMDSKVLDLIIEDIESNGAILNANIKKSNNNNAAKDLIDRLDNLTFPTQSDNLGAPEIIRSGLKRMQISHDDLEDKLMENLSNENNTEYLRSSLKYIIDSSIKKGDEAEKKGIVDEAINHYLRAFKALDEIYLNIAKSIGDEKAQQLKKRDETLGEIQRKLARSYYDFAMILWHENKKPSTVDWVIGELEAAIFNHEEIFSKTHEDEQWLIVYRRDLVKALICQGDNFFRDKNEEALKNYLKAIEICESTPGVTELHTGAAKRAAFTLDILSMQDSKKTDFATRIAYLKQGIKLLVNSSSKEDETLNTLRRHLCQVLQEKASQFKDGKDYDRAIATFQEAIDVLKSMDLPEKQDKALLMQIENQIKETLSDKEPFKPIFTARISGTNSPIHSPTARRPQPLLNTSSPISPRNFTSMGGKEPGVFQDIKKVGGIGSGFTSFSKNKTEEKKNSPSDKQTEKNKKNPKNS